MNKRMIIKAVCALALLAVCILTLTGVITGKKVIFRAMKPAGEMLTREDIEYRDVEAPEAASAARQCCRPQRFSPALPSISSKNRRSCSGQERNSGSAPKEDMSARSRKTLYRELYKDDTGLLQQKKR